ncbi:hypothetical protein QYF36_014716 [Acer negundo]|nr:hypothetical protein QYF36_014716 [Acer negundo]
MFEEYLSGNVTMADVRKGLKSYIYTFFGAGDIARVMLIFDTSVENINLRLEDVNRICVSLRKAVQCNDIVMHAKFGKPKLVIQVQSEGVTHTSTPMNLSSGIAQNSPLPSCEQQYFPSSSSLQPTDKFSFMPTTTLAQSGTPIAFLSSFDSTSWIIESGAFSQIYCRS